MIEMVFDETSYKKSEHKKAVKMAKIMLIDGKPIDEIIKYTELSRKEIEEIKKIKQYKNERVIFKLNNNVSLDKDKDNMFGDFPIYDDCPLFGKEIDIYFCDAIQRARIGLFRKSLISKIKDWIEAGKICDTCPNYIRAYPSKNK